MQFYDKKFIKKLFMPYYFEITNKNVPVWKKNWLSFSGGGGVGFAKNEILTTLSIKLLNRIWNEILTNGNLKLLNSWIILFNKLISIDFIIREL